MLKRSDTLNNFRIVTRILLPLALHAVAMYKSLDMAMPVIIPDLNY